MPHGFIRYYFLSLLLKGLENVVKNMLTSLRAVTELQNPAIRERHWQQLMQVSKSPAWIVKNETQFAGVEIGIA